MAHDDAVTAAATAGVIEKELAVWTVADLLEDCYVHVYPAGWVKALLRLGAGAPLRAHQAIVDHVVFSATARADT